MVTSPGWSDNIKLQLEKVTSTINSIINFTNNIATTNY